MVSSPIDYMNVLHGWNPKSCKTAQIRSAHRFVFAREDDRVVKYVRSLLN